MKKALYIAVLSALTLTGCSDDDTYFNQSAAERLEQYKAQYREVLTSGSGLWSVEYFSNPDEPGYVYVMKFNPNGSVEMSTNHKWIDNQFKQETSLWTMISDNGPVLSFNSYNNLFHVFADPADIPEEGMIVGGNAAGSVNETGFGHSGDYEFQVMEVSDDGQTIRLMGKKRLHYIYMHKLPADTDIEAFIAEVVAVPTRFSETFNDFMMTTEDGETFRVFDLMTGIPSVFPLDGDAVEQTVSGNGIFTKDGLRFMTPLEIMRADESTFELTALYFNPDGTMSGEGIADLRALSPMENLARIDLVWNFDFDALTGKAKELFDKANEEAMAVKGKSNTLKNWQIQFAQVNGEFIPQLKSLIGKKICFDDLKYDYETSNGYIVPSYDFHYTVVGKSAPSEKLENELPAYVEFKNYLSGHFTMTVNDPMVPNVITLTDKSDSNSSFVLKL